MKFADFLSAAREQGVVSVQLSDGTVIPITSTKTPMANRVVHDPVLLEPVPAPGRRRRKFGRVPLTIKRAIARRTKSGETYESLANEYGISVTTVYRYSAASPKRKQKSAGPS